MHLFSVNGSRFIISLNDSRCLICFVNCRVLLSVIGFLIIAATIHDWAGVYCGCAPADTGCGGAVRVLHCFSALSNGRKLLAAGPPSGSTNFACLSGIRVISTMWVVMGHTYYILSLTRVANLSAILKVQFSLTHSFILLMSQIRSKLSIDGQWNHFGFQCGDGRC